MTCRIICPSLSFFHLQNLSNPMVAQFLAGGTAGTIQWLPPIYCFDVIKSRMQTAPQGTYTSISDCAKQMYKENGIKVFFRYVTSNQIVQRCCVYMCRANHFICIRSHTVLIPTDRLVHFLPADCLQR